MLTFLRLLALHGRPVKVSVIYGAITSDLLAGIVDNGLGLLDLNRTQTSCNHSYP